MWEVNLRFSAASTQFMRVRLKTAVPSGPKTYGGAGGTSVAHRLDWM